MGAIIARYPFLIVVPLLSGPLGMPVIPPFPSFPDRTHTYRCHVPSTTVLSYWAEQICVCTSKVKFGQPTATSSHHPPKAHS